MSFQRSLLLFLVVMLLCLTAGCTEFMHWGHIRDREGTFAVDGVEIAQSQPGGGWKVLGRTDGKGCWEIFKHEISGGGRVRISKPGYRTMYMSESEFRQSTQILLQATGEEGYGSVYEDM